MADVAWGSLGGVVLAGGLVALYAGYARARVSIAAPVAGVGAAALPVIVASLFGDDTLSPTATRGGPARAAGHRAGQHGPFRAARLRRLQRALRAGWRPSGSGCCWSVSPIRPRTAVLWPIVAARGSGFVVLSVVIAARRLALSTSRGVWLHVIGIAALVTAGNALFLTAARLGSTSVAGCPLASLFPAATVFWAWLVFRERLRGVQLLGLGVALVAVALIVSG